LFGAPGGVILDGTVVGHSLDADTVTLDLACLLETLEVGHNVRAETVLAGDEDSLATGELEAGVAESSLGVVHVLGKGADGNKGGANVNAGGLDVGLAESVAHTLLESISTSAGKHLVDADGVPGVDTDTDMETFLTSAGDHILVGSNTGRLKGFRADHFLFLGDKMDAAREIGPLRLLLATIVNADLGVRHTTVVARLGVGFVLLVSVATSWSSSHLNIYNNYLYQEFAFWRYSPFQLKNIKRQKTRFSKLNFDSLYWLQ